MKKKRKETPRQKLARLAEENRRRVQKFRDKRKAQIAGKARA